MQTRSLRIPLVLILLMLTLLAGCGGNAPSETAADCLFGEVYDAEDQVCYEALDCETDAACQEEGDSLVDLILGGADSLLTVAMDPGVEGWQELNEVALVTYQVQGNRISNPEEDIAEAWTMFVLNPKPAGDSIAEEKMLFFYDYPELVKLRAEIASRTYSRFRRLEQGLPGQ